MESGFPRIGKSFVKNNQLTFYGDRLKGGQQQEQEQGRRRRQPLQECRIRSEMRKIATFAIFDRYSKE